MQLNSADMASLASSIWAVDASFLSGGTVRWYVSACWVQKSVTSDTPQCGVLPKLSLWSSDLLPIFLLVNQEFNFT